MCRWSNCEEASPLLLDYLLSYVTPLSFHIILNPKYGVKLSFPLI